MSIKYTPIENKPAYEIMVRNGYIVNYCINYARSVGECSFIVYIDEIEYSDYLFN